MLKAILNTRGELGNDTPFNLVHDGNTVEWSESNPVIFNIRIPINSHKTILFDKISFFNM